MRNSILLAVALLFMTSCSVLSPIQKSKFITLSNLIDAGKYAEAKEIVDGMTEDKDAMRWAKTWYYKGLLCQNAYADGLRKDDKSLMELYPDQLFLAYGCYRKALTFDSSGRMERQVASKLVQVANELQKMGERSFKEKKYEESLQAFERAFKVTRISFLSLEMDSSLIYNTGLAAYEAQNMDKAIEYLTKLHKHKYSVNATHLLSDAYLHLGDTTQAISSLYQGVKYFDYNEDLMLLSTELLYESGKADVGLIRLNEAIERKPNSFTFHYAKGLLFQKMNSYPEAIVSYTKAHELAPSNAKVNVNIATCYYNTGVAVEENIMHLTSIREVNEQKALSAQAFSNAIEWLQKVKNRRDLDGETLQEIVELSNLLSATNGSLSPK